MELLDSDVLMPNSITHTVNAKGLLKITKSKKREKIKNIEFVMPKIGSDSLGYFKVTYKDYVL